MSEAPTCPPETCICCVCVLRRSEEFGTAFEAEDQCCRGCHGEMAAEGWPGDRCPSGEGEGASGDV